MEFQNMSDVKYTQGKIADFGYEDFKGKDTFYLVLQNEQGQNLPPVRGKGLEEAFKQVDNLQKGDSVNLKDMGIDEVTKKRMWEVERHEPYQNLENAIEHDVERDLQKIQTLDKTKEESDEKVVSTSKQRTTDLDQNLPDSIKYNYVAISKNRFMKDEKINYYDKSDPDKVNIAFEDRKNGLHTSRQDEKTIKAMMDLAESKGWTAIKLKGTEEFKQKAWLEASLRGIETKGYEPTEKDKAELIAKQEARTVNQVEATAVKEPTSKEIPEPVAQQPIVPKEPVSHEQATQMVYAELLKNGWQMQKVDSRAGEYPSKTMTDEQGREHQVYVSSHDYTIHMNTPYLNQHEPTSRGKEVLHINYSSDEAKQTAERLEQEYQKFNTEYTKSKEESFIKPKEILAETAITAVTPAPLQSVVGAGFLAKDVNNITEYASEKIEDLSKDIKAQIRKITQDGYRDGSITNRLDLVKALTVRGYEVVKENEKSIRLKIPNSEQHLTLKGEMFTKDFDAIKQLKASLEPEAIKERFPQISDVGIAQITAWKNHVTGQYTTPQAQQEILHRLDSSVKEVANGKDLGMPPIPANEIKPDIEVQINTGDKSRSR